MTPSRMVYELAREPFLIEELRFSHHLPSTVHYDELLAERKRKCSEINMAFCATEAMINWDWMNTDQPQWHVLTHFSVHGFHYKICVKAGFHRADEDCMCSLCGCKCDQYHLETCTRRAKSLIAYSR